MPLIISHFGPLNNVELDMTGLPNNSRVASAVIDNSVVLYKDMFVRVQFRTGNGALGKNGTVQVGILTTLDDTIYDNILKDHNVFLEVGDLDSATDYTITINTERIGPLPPKFKFAVKNISGKPFSTSVSKFSLDWMGRRDVEVTNNASMISSNWDV